MAPNELLQFVSPSILLIWIYFSSNNSNVQKNFFKAKRVALYMARTCPNRLLDELMTELQTVETLNCLIERTETPPFYRLTSMRKASSHSDGDCFSILSFFSWKIE